MTQRLFYVLFLVVFGPCIVLAQNSDTLSVHFAFGKHEISAKQAKRIQAIPNHIYVNDLDSVHYIGMADSVGSLRANHKLGEKRAREVLKYSKNYFTTNPLIRIFSRGELQRDDPANNRRVDFVFFSKPVV
jgi:outer membrane protein OmpA-like peptidoglycan-associated protein